MSQQDHSILRCSFSTNSSACRESPHCRHCNCTFGGGVTRPHLRGEVSHGMNLTTFAGASLSRAADADYTRAALFLKDIGKEEKGFGIWLSCITTHEDLLAKIRDAAIYEGVYPLDLMSGLNSSEEITHSEFMAFVRAYVGVASVLAAKFLDICDLSPLLLLPQMTFRLECMTTGNGPRTTAGINAESLLFALRANAQSFLNSYFVCCLRGCEPWGLTSINERERADVERAAKIADEGVGAAVEELLGIRAVRVAVAVIMHALEDNTESGTRCGDWTVLEAVWGERTHGLLNYAIDVLTRIGVEVKQGFSLTPSALPTICLEPLLLVTNESLHLIASLHAPSITTSRAIRMLMSHRTNLSRIALYGTPHLLSSMRVPMYSPTVGCVRTVIPQILTPLVLFFRHLEPVHKVQLVQRLVSLDRGVLGLGDFLVQGEVKRLASLLKVMAERGIVTQWEVGTRLEFVARLMEGEDGDWCIAALHESQWGTIMTGLLEANLYSKHVGMIAGWLAANPESLGIELRLSVVAALLRGVQVQEPSAMEIFLFQS
ncbi:hypothetical protein BDR05DRAFT_952318 [Suillus weaverae]|nr:hypothetical protein BDR05DRAFT_952318 [Suillus weaverae]